MDGINYFMPGQVWQYDTRPGEENSRLTVLQIDEEEAQVIVHIRLEQLPFLPNGIIQHMPFTAEALMASVTDFVQHLEAVPDFREGYEAWKQQYDAGKGGYWKIAVKHAVESFEHILNRKS